MTKYHTHKCSIAAALNLLGDRWSLLIVREALYGADRFGQFQRNTAISKNLLTDRLNQLVADGILERVAFADRGTNHVYRLTESGRALETTMVALQQWADRFVYGEGKEPVRLFDKASDRPVPQIEIKDASGEPISFDGVTFKPGPGADKHTRRRLSEISPPR